VEHALRRLPLIAAVLWLSGCCDAHIQTAAELRLKLEDSAKKHKELDSRIASLEADIKSRENQVAELQGTAKVRRERLVRVHRIELSPFTKGRNFDDKPGDDGFKIYLNLLDAEGDLIKQAGRVRAELFDLDAAGRRLGLWEFDLDEAAGNWNSLLGNYGYVFECRWQKDIPIRSPMTLRVRFTDLFSGRTHEIQTPIVIEFPPASVR
jgi:hypothetical protein